MSHSASSHSGASTKWTARFLLPPAIVIAAGFLTRWAIQHSLWFVAAVFPVVAIVCAIWCMILGGEFAFSRQAAVPRNSAALFRTGGIILLWIIAGTALAFVGLLGVNALPFRVGDGP